jgi:hypothetical protein
VFEGVVREKFAAVGVGVTSFVVSSSLHAVKNKLEAINAIPNGLIRFFILIRF